MKTHLIIVALLIATTAFAQIEKGKSYAGGQLGGGSIKSTYEVPGRTGPAKQTAFDAAVSYGYMVSSTWAVALSVEGSINTSKTITPNNTSKSVGTGYSISPYVRKYFPIAEKFYFHLDGGLNYQKMKSKYTDLVGSTPTEFNTKASSIYIAPGLTYFLSNRFALTSSLGTLNYTTMKDTGSDNVTQKGLTTSFGLNSITFGASVYF